MVIISLTDFIKWNHVFSKDFAMNVLTKVWPSTTRPWFKKTFHFYNCLALTFQHCGLGHDKADPCLPVPGGLTQHLPHGNTHLLKSYYSWRWPTSLVTAVELFKNIVICAGWDIYCSEMLPVNLTVFLAKCGWAFALYRSDFLSSVFYVSDAKLRII